MELNRTIATLLAFLLIASITITGIAVNEQFNNETLNENQTTEAVCNTVNQSFDNNTVFFDHEKQVCIDRETNQRWRRV